MEPEFLSPQKDMVSSFFSLKDGTVPGNKSLIFDRYLDIWEKQSESHSWQKVQDIYPCLKGFSKHLQAVDTALLKDIHSRQQLIIKDLGQTGMGEAAFTVAWRLVCGLGYDHPLENGFSIDYTTGIPYIPASSIKGLCRVMAGHYARDDSLKDQWKASELRALFGSEDSVDLDHQAEEQLLHGQGKELGLNIPQDDTSGNTSKSLPLKLSNDKALGDIIFLDAYPHPGKPIIVVPDIVNTHHQAYYHSDLYIAGNASETGVPPEDGAKILVVSCPENGAPMETENPVPVFFLTIGAGSCFVFRFFSRTCNQANMKKIAMALEEGLSFLGIGAKTAAGYGRLIRDGDEDKNGDPERDESLVSQAASEVDAWLNKTIEEVSRKHNEPKLRNLLVGKPLAEAWQQVDEDALKQDIFSELRRRWEAINSRPSKKAQKIYQLMGRE